jgi:hypothetical protein
VPSGDAFLTPWAHGDWPDGEALTEIILPAAGEVGWRFEDGVYVRFQEGSRTRSSPRWTPSSSRLTRDTLVVMVANQQSAGYHDSSGLDVPTFDVAGGDDLYVLHAGQVIEGTWSRPHKPRTTPSSTRTMRWCRSRRARCTGRSIVPEGQPIDLGGRSKGRQGAGPLPNEIGCQL